VNRVDSLNLPQRIVLVVATGLVIRVLTTWLLVGNALSSGGWFGYAPDTAQLFRPDARRFSTFVTAMVLLVGIVGWVAISLRLLARKGRPE
jgi:hypothetical protein